MGTLQIAEFTIPLEDDVLRHVTAVLIAKFRRREPVLLTWTEPSGRREQMLMQPTTTFLAGYDIDDNMPVLDGPWLGRLMVAANGTAGIDLDRATQHAHTDEIPTQPRRPWHITR